MIRVFDLAAFENEVNQLLNDPELRLHSLEVNCSKETGYTTATLNYSPCEWREPRFKRRLERFVLIHGGHPEIDRILKNKQNRLVKKYVFPTAEGVVVVIDYQIEKSEREVFSDGAF